MAHLPDPGEIDLTRVFARVQTELRAQLSTGGLFQHPSAAGDASEHCWLELFNRYLPKRYRAAPAFVVDSLGRRSRQIDLAVFDNLYSPLLFPHGSGLHVPAESIYAVFEIKTVLTPHYIKYAGEIAGSVRALKRTSIGAIANGKKCAALEPKPILAGILAATSMWTPETLEPRVRKTMALLKPTEKLDLGCALDHGAFEYRPGKLVVSAAEESLEFFMGRLLERLQQIGTAPAIDLRAYFRSRR